LTTFVFQLGYQNLDSACSGGSKEDSLHCHQSRQEGVDTKARRKLVTASVLCLLFMIAEVVGGVLSNSLAIATDAAHLLTDFASFLISLFAIWMAAKPKSQKMSFGWHRAEVLGATVSVLMIWLVTGVLVYMAILRVIHQEFEINAVAMLVTSGLGLLFNILMGATLHQHGHGHGGGGGGHGHSHGGKAGHDAEKAQEGHSHGPNINVTAAFIHVIGDFLQSVGVFTAAVVIYFKPEWSIIDPICTFIFSILVLMTTISILRQTLNILLEATPSDVNYDLVKNTFLSVKGIRQIHNLRIWGLTTNKTALAAHLAVDQGLDAQEVRTGVKGRLHRNSLVKLSDLH
jgi:cation diffusion facilitator family transporter